MNDEVSEEVDFIRSQIQMGAVELEYSFFLCHLQENADEIVDILKVKLSAAASLPCIDESEISADKGVRIAHVSITKFGTILTLLLQGYCEVSQKAPCL